MKKLERIDDENYFYPFPTDDDIRTLLKTDPTACRHSYSKMQYCVQCTQALLSIAIAELKDRRKKK
jgi:hypothetical protein